MGSVPLSTKLQLFFTHLTVESKFVDALKKHLIQDFIGLVEVFVASDATSIPSGSQWLNELIEALNKAHLQVILCSKESITRPWINYEAGAARVRGIRVVPLCHSGLRPGQLPYPLCESEGVELNAEGLKNLYKTIADLLGSSIPLVDFSVYARELEGLEREYEAQQIRDEPADIAVPSAKCIPHPRVLCVTSEQFRKIGFENQLQRVLDAFPRNLKHDIVTSSAELRRILTGEHVDILHIATFVCPRSGLIYFSDVDLLSGQSTVPDDQVDKINPEALCRLIAASRAVLVVVGSCESLALVTALLSTTDVIAASDMISSKSMAVWVDQFYGQLKTKALVDAFDFATKTSMAPMRFYARQRPLPNLRFGDAKDGTKTDDLGATPFEEVTGESVSSSWGT